MVQACVKRFGRLDILINSAGSRGAHGTLEEEFSAENLRDVMDVDFNSTFWAIKYAYPGARRTVWDPSSISPPWRRCPPGAHRLHRGEGGSPQRVKDSREAVRSAGSKG